MVIRSALIGCFVLVPFIALGQEVDNAEEPVPMSPETHGPGTEQVGSSYDPKRPKVGYKVSRRKGAMIGLDPGFSLLLRDGQTPLNVRIHLRIGYCVTDWFQVSADLRYDILVTLKHAANFQTTDGRLGPALNFFLVKGWFLRPSALINLGEPISASVGTQTGYEFMHDKFTAMGFALGADYEFPVEKPVNEQTPMWIFAITFYLTAYDLGTRFGRDPGAP